MPHNQDRLLTERSFSVLKELSCNQFSEESAVVHLFALHFEVYLFYLFFIYYNDLKLKLDLH
jgi:hypothetical protein